MYLRHILFCIYIYNSMWIYHVSYMIYAYYIYIRICIYIYIYIYTCLFYYINVYKYNLSLFTSSVCIEDTTADLLYRRGEQNHNNVGVYELYR